MIARDSGPLAAVQGHLSRWSDADENSDSNRSLYARRRLQGSLPGKHYAAFERAAVQIRHNETRGTYLMRQGSSLPSLSGEELVAHP